MELRLSGVRDATLFGMFGRSEILRICVDRKLSIRVRNYTVCLKKTCPTFLAVTRESIVGFS